MPELNLAQWAHEYLWRQPLSGKHGCGYASF